MITQEAMAAHVAAFNCEVAKIAARQCAYDLATNVPAGIVTAAQAADPQRLIKKALASAFATFVRWDISAAVEFAADVLEEVNARSEAATVRQFLDLL